MKIISKIFEQKSIENLLSIANKFAENRHES